MDRWGSKYELFILPFIGFFILLLTSLLEKAPHLYNYPERINESNAEQFYVNSRKMLNAMKNICMVFFAYLIFQTVSIALDGAGSPDSWFLPALIVSFFIPLGIGLYKQSKIL